MRFLWLFKWITIKKIIAAAFKKRLMGLAAEMAFNAMLALFPAILAILTALAIFEKPLEYTVTSLALQYKDVFPEVAWQLLENFISQISATKNKGLFSLSFIGAIWISSGALSTAMNALDEIHQIPRKKRRGFWRAKFVSILITTAIIILLILASFIILIGDFLVKLILNLVEKLPINSPDNYLLFTLWQILSWPVALGTSIIILAFIYQIYHVIIAQKRKHLHQARGILALLILAIIFLLLIIAVFIFINYLFFTLKIDAAMTSLVVKFWQFSSLPVAIIIICIAFAVIYRIGPSRWVEGSPILPGAILAAISWAGLSYLFRLYVANYSNYNKVYGAVGAVIILMIWLQLSSLIVLVGCQINVIVGEEYQKISKLPSRVTEGKN